MTLKEIEQRYSLIPQEIRNLRRWICYNIEVDEKTGEKKKVPVNAITGNYARSNDATTWTTFNIAMLGCEKYDCYGLGFMLGEDNITHTTYFGIDLDNHPDRVTGEKLGAEQFKAFCNEFINALDSYTELSHSGEGIHIICKGTLPVGARRKAGVAVEMYDKGRFFTMTGKVVRNVPINERTEQVRPLWEKYLYTEPVQSEPTQSVGIIVNADNSVIFGGADRLEQTVSEKTIHLDDNELIQKIKASQNGQDFIDLFNGDMSSYGNDHSGADMALCKILAFWTGCDFYQIDRIFRRSALMRDKWDQKRSATNRKGVALSAGTYGSQTIEYAISGQRDVYAPKEKVVINNTIKTANQNNEPVESDIIEFDDKGDPIVTLKKVFKRYELTDTGNAERFYDHFGDRFKFNVDNNTFMFWNGKTWSKDSKNYVKKYADKILDVLELEIRETEQTIKDLGQNVADDENLKQKIAYYDAILKAQVKNKTRVSNTAGKNAMITEMEHLHDLSVTNRELDTQEYFLNTDSGVVDLQNGKILPYDKNYLLSKNTNNPVDFSEPKVFLKFLKDIFWRNNEEETQEIIDTVQMLLGEALTGRINKDKLVILYGSGSNGKSTFISTVSNVIGEYAKTVNSALLIQNPGSGMQSTEFSMSSLLGARFVHMSETPAGKQLDENLLKQMTSGEPITAQYKFGQIFEYLPTFSLWMSTNNKPIIRATDFGTWRRLFLIPFENKFTDANKDMDMPKKLEKEYPQILGWMIQGHTKLHTVYKDILPKPKCLEEALSEYKNEMDVLVSFAKMRCVDFPGFKTSAVDMYQEYKEWAKTNNEFLMSETKFRSEFPKRGYVLEKDANVGYVYVGIKLAKNKSGISFADWED